MLTDTGPCCTFEALLILARNVHERDTQSCGELFFFGPVSVNKYLFLYSILTSPVSQDETSFVKVKIGASPLFGPE